VEDKGGQLATDKDFERVWKEIGTLLTGSSESESVAVRNAMGTMKYCLKDRRLFITMHDRIGLGPTNLVQSDVLAILLGLDMPLILRQTDDNSYRIIGNAYIGGVMDGELFKRCQKIQRLHIL
jgi:hypothetical protein